jgi:DNA-binding XRE family transcriptional regulator
MTRFSGAEPKLIRKFLGVNQTQLARIIGSKQVTISWAEKEKEHEYVSHDLNMKLNKGLIEHGFDPEALMLLIEQYKAYIQNKLDKGEL